MIAQKSIIKPLIRDIRKECKEIKLFSSYTLFNSASCKIPATDIDILSDYFCMSQKSLIDIISIPQSTFRRKRNNNEIIDSIFGDRILRLMRVYIRAVSVFENEDSAKSWLNKPLKKFQMKSPIEFLNNDEGVREVERLLGQIEHSVYA